MPLSTEPKSMAEKKKKSTRQATEDFMLEVDDGPDEVDA